MKNLLKIFSLILCLLTVVSLVASCANGGGDDTSAPSAQTTAAAGDQSEDSADDTEFQEDKLGKMNLGTEINVLAWKDVEHEEFESEGTNGDLVNDAIFTRNAVVCDRLGITINWIREDGDSDYRSQWNNKIANAITSGLHEYDVAAGYSLSITLDASSGYLYNMLDTDKCPYLDFAAPWWSALLVKQGTIKDKLFFGSGDISRNALEMMYVCFVNTDLLEDHNLENPQNLVDSGDWTYAKFIEMCKGIYRGDGSKNEDEDTFGYMCSGIHQDPWFYGSGALICEINDDGNIVESPSFFSDKVINTIDMIQALYSSLDGIYTSSVKHQKAFRDGRLLFCTDRCRVSHKVLAENADCHYLVVPCPKYDKDQERYYTVMGNPFTMYGIISDTPKKAECSAFIECMASEGYRNITPAVFELSLKTKYVNDPTSARMYDIVRENLVYDIGRLFSTDLIGQGTFRNSLSSGSNNWAAQHKGVSNNIKTACKKLNAAFNKN